MAYSGEIIKKVLSESGCLTSKQISCFCKRKYNFDTLINFRINKTKSSFYGYELLSLMEERHYKYIVNFTKFYIGFQLYCYYLL